MMAKNTPHSHSTLHKQSSAREYLLNSLLAGELMTSVQSLFLEIEHTLEKGKIKFLFPSVYQCEYIVFFMPDNRYNSISRSCNKWFVNVAQI